MAVNDIRSNLKRTIVMSTVITTDTTTVTGTILDTANYELGLMFDALSPSYTDGTYTLQIVESDDSGMSGSTVVTGDKLIGPLPVVSAGIAQGTDLDTVGVISTKRYVRANVVSTATSSGATIEISATQKAENMPVV